MWCEIEVVHRARGINGAYWAVILWIKQVLQRMADGHFRGFFRLMDAHFFYFFLLVDNDAKAQRAALLCPCECFCSAHSGVCLSTHARSNRKTLTYMGDNLYGRSLHFSYLWRGEEEEGCGVMCFARLPAASGRELYTKQPPI